MGADVQRASPAARAVYEAADRRLGRALSTLCFEGPSETLTATENTQPAIVTTSMAILAAMRERLGDALPEPVCAAGHSLGEYSALCAAGALSPEDAADVCRVRGAAMQAAAPADGGAMAAVMGPTGPEVTRLCEGLTSPDAVVAAANYNAPTQTVIAGHVAAVARAGDAAKAEGARVIPLRVSAPFHCALMTPAREPLRHALASTKLTAPRFEVFANVDAQARSEPDAVVQALVDQVDQPVQWVATVRAMQAMGVTHALEVGPGRVLAGLVKRIVGRDLPVLSVNRLETIDEVPAFLEGEKARV